MKINIVGGELSRAEIDAYIEYGMRKYSGRRISGIDIKIDGEFVDLKFHFNDTDFQHAYRSNDYLVNSIDKLNDSKRSEFIDKERCRVLKNESD